MYVHDDGQQWSRLGHEGGGPHRQLPYLQRGHGSYSKRGDSFRKEEGQENQRPAMSRMQWAGEEVDMGALSEVWKQYVMKSDHFVMWD